MNPTLRLIRTEFINANSIDFKWIQRVTDKKKWFSWVFTVILAADTYVPIKYTFEMAKMAKMFVLQ